MYIFCIANQITLKLRITLSEILYQVFENCRKNYIEHWKNYELIIKH